jgi:hypothetical protein
MTLAWVCVRKRSCRHIRVNAWIQGAAGPEGETAKIKSQLVKLKDFPQGDKQARFKRSDLKAQILNIRGLPDFSGHNDKVG